MISVYLLFLQKIALTWDFFHPLFRVVFFTQLQKPIERQLVLPKGFRFSVMDFYSAFFQMWISFLSLDPKISMFLDTKYLFLVERTRIIVEFAENSSSLASFPH